MQHRCEVNVRKCNGLVRGTLILKHRGFGRGVCLEVLHHASACLRQRPDGRWILAVLEQLLRPILFGWEHCPTVLASRRGDTDNRSPFGLPTVLRFARFRARDISLSVIGLQVRRETAQIAKGWPSFRSSLPRSRSFLIRDRQQSGIVAKLGITGEQNCTAAVSAAGGVTVGRVLPALASACRRDGGGTANAAIPSPTLRQYPKVSVSNV